MARKSEHTINRKLSDPYKGLVGARSVLVAQSYLYLDDDVIEFSKQYRKFVSAYDNAVEFIAEMFPFEETSFEPISDYHPKDCPDIMETFVCLGEFIGFNVCSPKDFKEFFSDEGVSAINKETGIYTFKDNCSEKCSDSICVFNASVLYTVNRVRSLRNRKYIPFGILNDLYDELDTFAFGGDKVSFWLNVYNKLKELYSPQNEMFSDEVKKLFRAYEKYYYPSEKAIETLKKANKELEKARREKKKNLKEHGLCSNVESSNPYSDFLDGRKAREIDEKYHELEKPIKKHISVLRKSRLELLSFIIRIISGILEADEETDMELEEDTYSDNIFDLLHHISNEFDSRNVSADESFSYNEALCFLNRLSSASQVVEVTEALRGLSTIKAGFARSQFSSIILHLLEDTEANQIRSISTEETARHFADNGIDNDSVMDFFDSFSDCREVSDTYRIMVNKLISTVNTDPALFKRIHDMVMAFTV